MSLLRRRARPETTAGAVDERVWGRHYTGPRPWVIGGFVALLAAALGYLAFSKELPFTDDGYTLEATFSNAATVSANSPVRIAGVKVGEVTGISGEGEAAVVTFTVDEEGRPIHDDAEVEIRPRLFLEGNFFLDLQPGSASAAELPDGGEIPITRTATAVQLDEVLTSLQSDSRRNLQQLLEGYGTALTYEPTAEDDADQDPAVRGETAGESLNDAFRHGGDAGRDTAIVNDALLGQNPRDLSGLIDAQRRVFTELDGRERQLQDLITNFNVTTGALAAESGNLSATIAELAPTLERSEPALAAVSASLPPLRALARELEPSMRELPGTIEAGTPWLEQTNLLLRDRELGGLARLLAQSTPGLAETTHVSRDLFPELNLLSRCTSQVLVPTGEIPIDDDGIAGGQPFDFTTGEPNYREFLYSTVGISGESQGFDGNGSYVRFQAGGGPQLSVADYPNGTLPNNLEVYGNNIDDVLGSRPAIPPTGTPPVRTDVPCHANPVPAVNGQQAAVGPPSPQSVP